MSIATGCSRRLHAGLQALLWVLSTRLGALVLTGRAVPIPSQSLAARHALLKKWSVSRIGKFREAFQVSGGSASTGAGEELNPS